MNDHPQKIFYSEIVNGNYRNAVEWLNQYHPDAEVIHMERGWDEQGTWVCIVFRDQNNDDVNKEINAETVMSDNFHRQFDDDGSPICSDCGVKTDQHYVLIADNSSPIHKY